MNGYDKLGGGHHGPDHVAPMNPRSTVSTTEQATWSIGDVVQSIYTDNAYSRRRPGVWDGPESGVRYADQDIDNLVFNGSFRVLRKQSAEVK